MKKLFPKLLFILTTLILIGLPVGYGLMNNFEFVPLINALVALPLAYLTFAQAWLSNISFAGLTNLIFLGGTGLGLLLGLLVLIRGFVVRRPLLGLLSFFSIILFFVLAVSLVVPGAFNNPGLRYFEYLLSELATNLLGSLFILGLLLTLYLFLFQIFIFGLKSKTKKAKTKATAIKIESQTAQSSPATQTANLIQPTPSTGVALNQDQSLNDLVKMVMAEELNAMRGGYGQPQVPPGYPVNMGQPSPYAMMDLNLVRRIVVEELAKFQGHYVSRPEVQTLIAQEIAMLKSQLKIK
jgi:uncharacterized membrane protein YciS (DUF1049 family)